MPENSDKIKTIAIPVLHGQIIVNVDDTAINTADVRNTGKANITIDFEPDDKYAVELLDDEITCEDEVTYSPVTTLVKTEIACGVFTGNQVTTTVYPNGDMAKDHDEPITVNHKDFEPAYTYADWQFLYLLSIYEKYRKDYPNGIRAMVTKQEDKHEEVDQFYAYITDGPMKDTAILTTDPWLVETPKSDDRTMKVHKGQYVTIVPCIRDDGELISLSIQSESANKDGYHTALLTCMPPHNMVVCINKNGEICKYWSDLADMDNDD